MKTQRPSIIQFVLSHRLAQFWLGLLVFNVFINAISLWPAFSEVKVHESQPAIALEVCASPEWNVAREPSDSTQFFVAGVAGTFSPTFSIQKNIPATGFVLVKSTSQIFSLPAVALALTSSFQASYSSRGPPTAA